MLLLLLSFANFCYAVASKQMPLATQNAPEAKSNSKITTENDPKYSNLLDSSFDDFVANLAEEWGMKGLSVAVVQHQPNGSWIVETKGYGVMNTAGDPVTADTIMPINSNSKLFTAMAMGLLIDKNLGLSPDNSTLPLPVTWRTKVKSILKDDWALQDPLAESETDLVDLAAHRTGLPRHEMGWQRRANLRDTIRSMRWLRPSAAWRDAFQYTNWGYMTLAHIISVLSRQSFHSFVDQHIFAPLNLTRTTYNTSFAASTGRFAEGFITVRRGVPKDEGGIGFLGAEHKAVELFIDEITDVTAGPGGVMMNAKDAATWLQTLLLEGKHPLPPHDQIIPSALVKRLARGVTPMSSSLALPYPDVSIKSYGGGGQWMYAYQGTNIVEHNGGWFGWLSLFSRAPREGLGIAVLTNWDEGAHVMEAIKYRLYERALGLNSVDWSAR
ncbi:beta-lactamase/transpeptidase-like protein [Clavulina sp. PMI_390]|nr:beta-lactamase/transpeptidase-like protein [Clavulina sp. PMI_390]